QWYHVFVTYDGSGKAAGVKLYVNGKPEPTQVMTDQLKSTTHTTVPFKLGRRNTTSPVENLLLQDVRVYGRALSGLDVNRLAKATRAAWLASKPADKRSDAEKNELFDWWLIALDEGYTAVANKLGQLQQEEAAIRARGTVAHVMQEKGGDA